MSRVMLKLNLSVGKAILMVSLVVISSISAAEETPTATPKQATTVKKQQQQVTIESKVTGSQEQPKVLYIMPWQGVSNPIVVQDNEAKIILPDFKPINPKVFKQQVRDYAANPKD